MLSIDRKHPFRLSEIESLAPSEALYAAPEENEAAWRLASIDADAIQLIPLNKASDRGATLDSNQHAADKLARLQADGAVLLDARSLSTLLGRATGIPGHWRNVMGVAGGVGPAASIRFYGSRFRLLETGDIHVLSLSYDDGRWDVAFESTGDDDTADGHAAYVAIVGPVTESGWAAGD